MDFTRRTNTLFLLLSCFISIGIAAQSEEQLKADSLKNQLIHAKTDVDKVMLLIDIGFYSQDTTEKFSYLRKARELATKTGYKKGIADAYATEAYERLPYLDFSTLTYLYTEALKIRTEIKDFDGLAECYHELGLLDLQFKNYSHALFNFKKAIALNDKIQNKEWLRNNYESVASVYTETGKYDSAMYFLKAGERIALENDLDVALLYNSMANLFLHLDKPDSCAIYLHKSDSAFDASGNTYGHYWNAILTGDMLIRKGKPAEAALLFEEVYAFAREDENGELLMALIPELIDAYRLTKNYEKGFHLQDEWSHLKDSLVSLDKANIITGTQLKFEAEQREKVNALIRQKKDDEDKAEAERQKLIRNIFIGGFSVLGILSFVIFRSLQQNKRSKRIIETQKEEVEEKQREIVDSINYAKRLQDAILPPEQLVKNYFPESFILYKPKAIVAGDFYWMEKSGNTVFIAAADCTGHGVPGAMVSVVCSNALNRSVKEFGLKETGHILDKVRELVLETFEKSSNEVKDGMDISLVSFEFGVINSEIKSTDQISPHSTLQTPNSFHWSGANNPLWYVAGNEMHVIKADKQPVGKQENSKAFTTHRVEIPKGGMIYLFTDGYADQFGGPKGKKFRYKQLEELLLSIAALSPVKQHDQLEKVFLNWKGELEQIDDVCVIGIRV
ncbi:hypothetical protein BH11BAC7_BH11BAC7_27300 [soil metagenome]